MNNNITLNLITVCCTIVLSTNVAAQEIPFGRAGESLAQALTLGTVPHATSPS